MLELVLLSPHSYSLLSPYIRLLIQVSSLQLWLFLGLHKQFIGSIIYITKRILTSCNENSREVFIMKRKYFYEVIGGGAVFVLALALEFFIEGNSFIFLFLRSWGIAMVFIAVFQNYLHGKEKVSVDEVTKRINLKAQSYSWSATYFTLLGLGMINFFRPLSFNVAILTLLLIMSITFIISQLYLKKNPEKV